MTDKLKEALRIANEMKINPDFDPHSASEFFDNKHETSFMQVIYDAARAYSELPEKIKGLRKRISFEPSHRDAPNIAFNEALDAVLEIIREGK